MPKPTIRLAMELVYRHNRVTRLTHWIDGIMRRVQPNPEAQYVVFHCYGYRRPRNELLREHRSYRCKSPQTILPYEMNDEFVADIKYSARQRRLLGRSRLRVVRGNLMTCAIVRRLSTKKFLITSGGTDSGMSFAFNDI